MRLSPLILALLLVPVVTAQTPSQPAPQKTWRLEPWQTVPIPPGSENSLSTLPPEARLSIEVDGVIRTIKPAELQELLKQGKQVRQPIYGSEACQADYSKIRTEEKASDVHLGQMKARGEVIPVLHQFEQEMYYEDRYAMVWEETCGKSPPPSYPSNRKSPPDMRKKACAALGLVCKPVKHW